jgi:hypothetical protein
MIPTTKLANALLTVALVAGGSTGYRKVFAIGWNKTGTSSIHALFRSFGMVALHKRRWRQTWRPFVHFPYQAFSDGPAIRFDRLDRRFPRSRFILNVRDLDEWLDSRMEHRILKGHRPSVSEIRGWVLQRDRHHRRVVDHFKDRADDLLIVNFIREAGAAERIAEFLAADFAGSKPHVRPIKKRREPGRLENHEAIVQCMTELDIPADQWQSDLTIEALSNRRMGR